MEKITRVLEKINQGRTDQPLTLSDLMPLSFAEIRNTGQLSRDEALLLFRSAQKEKQNNILYTARALTRANPLLRKEMGRARYHGATPYGYDDIIVPRADEFAAPGAVSSMFSPAGYLTELYREARGLHQKDSPRNLDKRRPDLATLALSQSNLDDEVSTLALSNEQLETALMAQADQIDKIKYYETLATSRRSGVTPYNVPFEGIREALIQQDFILPDNVLTKGAESAAQMALYAGISPELYAILTEKTEGLSETETDALLKNNFPGINTDSLMDLNALANYYGLPRDEIQEMLEKRGAETPNVYRDDKLITHILDAEGKITLCGMIRELGATTTTERQYYYLDLISLGGKKFLVNFSATGMYTKYPVFQILISSKDDCGYTENNFIPERELHYSIPITLDNTPENRFLIAIRRRKDNGGWVYERCYFYPDNSIVVPSQWLLALNKLLRLAKATGITPLETQRALTRLNLTGNDSDATVLHRFCEFLLYRKRYNISNDDALILSGADINTVSYVTSSASLTGCLIIRR